MDIHVCGYSRLREFTAHAMLTKSGILFKILTVHMGRIVTENLLENQ